MMQFIGRQLQEARPGCSTDNRDKKRQISRYRYKDNYNIWIIQKLYIYIINNSINVSHKEIELTKI